MRQPCPECELRAIQSSITKESLEREVSAMKYVQGITAPENQYKNRLDICEKCSALVSQIMCSECGAYVLFRAKNKKSSCPRAKWAAQGC